MSSLGALQSAQQIAYDCKQGMANAKAVLLQVYKPELGPLDQRVTLSWLDGILEGEVNLEDTEYWFTEPEGPHRFSQCTAVRLLTDRPRRCVRLRGMANNWSADGFSSMRT